MDADVAADPDAEQGPGEAATPEETTRRKRRLRPRWRHVGTLLLVVGAVLCGGALSHLAWPPRVTNTTVVTGPDTAAPNGPAPVAADMPDVEGLDEPAARAVLADAGYASNAITTTTSKAAGTRGRVIAQQPPVGTPATAGTKVVLTLTDPAPMPNLVGKAREQAAATITAMHGAVQVKLVSTSTKPAGTVLSTTPKAGADMPAEVTLEVADGGASIPLAELDPVERSGCNDRPDAAVDGKSFSSAVECTPYPSETGFAYLEYALGRHGTFLEMTTGTNDRADRTTSRIRVIGDGKPIATATATLGKATTVKVPVTGVLRVRIEISTSDDNARVVLGDARVTGSATEIDRLLS